MNFTVCLAANMALFKYYDLNLIRSYEIGPILVSYQMILLQIIILLILPLPTNFFKFFLRKCPTRKFHSLVTKEENFYKAWAGPIRFLIYGFCYGTIIAGLTFTITVGFSINTLQLSQWLGALIFSLIGENGSSIFR